MSADQPSELLREEMVGYDFEVWFYREPCWQSPRFDTCHCR